MSWLLPAILLEIAILMFLWFRRSRRTHLFMIVPALFGFFSLLMFLLVIASYAANGPLDIDPQSQAVLITTFVVLLVLIIILPRNKSDYARNQFGDAARQRDLRNPPRKRSRIVDLLGCLSLGILAILMLGLLVAFGSSVGH
ncbi:hypothetical protein [Sphingomonas guangdongensis]|uniref:hypothetical protein n=1 Tax=Sphingomonas guangdongensis TaxID=1141890 RepID=UPI000BE29712|nr:hypothetical protein [Sphingomonas guangdongensis]